MGPVKKGEVMKNKVISTILSIILCAVSFAFVGCSSFEQLGETEAEGHSRHVRILRINRQALMEDIDAFLLMDQPTKLAEKQIP